MKSKRIKNAIASHGKMKKIFFMIFLLCTVSFSFAQKAGDKISFSSKDLNGAVVSDSLFAKNRLTMINIWGTFCPPCIREMPDLAKLNNANKEKNVEVVGIVIDLTDQKGRVIAKQKKDAETIISMTGADYTHIVPNPEMLSGFLRNVQVVPTTFFVDQNGKMVGKMYLGAKSQKEWQKIIDDLLSK